MSPPSFAVSRRVNPPGATPVLTEEQVWKGLGIKARDPRSFVPMITSSEVLSDDGTKVVRRVRFGDGEPVEEHIELHANTIAYFEMASTGVRITNVLSYNEDGELVLTFSFANGLPVAIEGQTAQEMNARMGKSVEHSIKRIRELAVQGVL